MADSEPTSILDDLKVAPRMPGFRYFAHGSVSPPVFVVRPTDFGNGYYAFEATDWGIDSAAAWARKQARRAGDVPVVELVRMGEADYAALNRLELDLGRPTDQFQWGQLVNWYRQPSPAPGPGDAYDVIVGPLATQRQGAWRPVTARPDQYRFLYYLRRNLEVVSRARA